jgi:hypothetical protein
MVLRQDVPGTRPCFALASESCRDRVWLKLRARRTWSIGRPLSSGSPGGSKTTLSAATKTCAKAGCTLSSCPVWRASADFTPPFIIFSWTLVTSTFSHSQLEHAFVNCLTFYFLAPTALTVLGNVQFLALYLGSAYPFFISPSPSSPSGTPACARMCITHIHIHVSPNRRCIREPRIASLEQGA